MITQKDLEVVSLGERTVPSPLNLSSIPNDLIADYTFDDARVLLNVEVRAGRDLPPPLLFERAGPRSEIYFEPKDTRVGIVTCGGLCPGINNVVRSMVLELVHKYGVDRIYGFRYGYAGLDPASGHEPVELKASDVQSVHKHGGSFLGLSRGKRDPVVIVDTLQRLGINILFTIGGDGTLRGAHAIYEEVKRRGAKIAIVGVPKTIDNDVPFVDKTFGYETAVEIARLAVDSAHTEAIDAFNGVGVVKLMGRDAGYIAAAATLASREVNYCLIPEVRFDMQGPRGLLASLERRLAERRHAVIVIAEGCGAHLADPTSAVRDASGNVRYASGAADIGPRMCAAIEEHFAKTKTPVSLKYIDPSYMIRSVPANAQDSIFCDALARDAVHAGMAGKTDVVIGRLHRLFTHVPLPLTATQKKRINPDGGLWLAVTEATGQPRMTNEDPLKHPSWFSMPRKS
jgi:6-phosphofructokinase 1